MPTVLMMNGWRLFFYSNEGSEPIHIHARKGNSECKYWIDVDLFEITEAWAYGMTPRLRREVRKIILQHLDQIADSWNNHLGDRT